MNERQLSLFIRHAFALERYGEDAVKVANPELRRAMLLVQERSFEDGSRKKGC